MLSQRSTTYYQQWMRILTWLNSYGWSVKLSVPLYFLIENISSLCYSAFFSWQYILCHHDYGLAEHLLWIIYVHYAFMNGYLGRFKSKFVWKLSIIKLLTQCSPYWRECYFPVYAALKRFVFPSTRTCSVFSLRLFKNLWSQLLLPHPPSPCLELNAFPLSSQLWHYTSRSRGFTCWSSGVHMPHVIWLSKLISDDQCLCPLTEPTRTNPSR